MAKKAAKKATKTKATPTTESTEPAVTETVTDPVKGANVRIRNSGL